MGLFTLECGTCGSIEEYVLFPHSGEDTASCSTCGTKLTVRHNRCWMIDGPAMQIQGDTVPGGCSYNYYDEHLGCQVKSKQHRKDEMKRQGLSDYSPDTDFASHQDTINHIRKHARKGDQEAATALRKEKKEMADKRMQRNVGNAMKESLHKAGL